MRNNSRSFMFFLMLIAVMLVSAVGSYPVYADEGTPADVSGEETVSQPTDEGTADVSGEETVSQSADEGTADVSGEESVSQPADEGIPADASTTEATPEPSDVGEQVPAETVAEILEQVPDGTDVVVVVDGVIEPMTTEVAAQVIVNSDPIWCKDGKNPGSATAGDCTSGYTNVKDLITALNADKTTFFGDGIIFFTSTYSIDDATFNGIVLTALGALTLQGGWNGEGNTSFGGTITAGTYALSGVTTFSVPVTIQNWTSNVFVNNILVNNVSGTGAYLDTCKSTSGACTGSGNVTVNNSHFNDNVNGLLIDSGGTITLNIVEATGNENFGAGLLNYDLLGAGGATITDGTFDNNFQVTGYTGSDAAGLHVNSKGDVTLTDVTANGNTNGAGTYLVSGGDVSITGTSLFNNNGDNGVWVDASGSITLDNVNAGNNGFDGADLVNDDGSGTVAVTNSIFSGNDNTGLYVVSNGAITLVDTQADMNNAGANLLNTGGSSGVSVTSSVAGTITSSFDDNDWTGLHIESNGIVTLADITASGNNTNGANVVTKGDVSVTHSQFNDNVQFNYPQDPGLYIKTDGSITLIDVVANNNVFGAGAVLISNADKAISVTGTTTFDIDGNPTGTSTFNNNGTFGVQAQNSTGNITLTDVFANENDVKGAYLSTSGTGTITIVGTDLDFDPSTFASAFNNNGSYGIYAHSEGDITVTGIEASFNGVKGMYLLASCTCPGNIFIYDSIFIENGAYGIYAQTNEGNIELDNVTVTGNNITDIGAFLRTDNGGHILVANSAFNLNTEAGLVIVSSGDDDPLTTADVNLLNVIADQNGENGAEFYSTYTYDCLCPGEIPVPVSILVSVDGGVFTNNGKYGLYALPGPEGDLEFVGPPPTGTTDFGDPDKTNGLGDYLLDLLAAPTNCAPCACGECCPPNKEPKEPRIVEIPKEGVVEPVIQDCETTSGTILQFFNGSHVKVGCPFEGASTASLVEQGNLPGRLPTGFTFVSAINIGLTSDGQVIMTMTENGNITLTFQIPEDMKDKKLSILFWDPLANNGQGDWVEMPLFEAGTSFPLNPDDPTNERTIISGVQQIGDTLTVTVNFPGVFVLVSR